MLKPAEIDSEGFNIVLYYADSSENKRIDFKPLIFDNSLELGKALSLVADSLE